jgi:predicted RNase H-like HicB family nuclease
MREAISMHIAGMREDGLQVPKPSARATYVRAAVQPRPRSRRAA